MPAACRSHRKDRTSGTFVSLFGRYQRICQKVRPSLDFFERLRERCRNHLCNAPGLLTDEAVNGRTLLGIQVPPGSQVCRHHGRIFDRNHEADIDITDNSDLVYRLYARKSGSYFVNKVTRFQMEDLRPDLIERARAMTASRTANHPWKSLSVEELLCSASLFLKDIERQLEGLTLEEIHLFGKGSTILSVLPQHKTDTIFRVENLEHYDDHDVIITKTYDRLIAFGQKHLGAPPLCRRVSKASVPENANRSHGHGVLHLSSFELYAQNPPISKVFREIGLADELGAGMRNTYKYKKLYSGGTPEFIEGDVFRAVVPLAPIAVEKVGPQDTTQAATLAFCQEPRSKAEIMQHCRHKSTKNFTQNYLRARIESGQLQMTIPDKPKSRNQKYITVQRGAPKN